MRALHHTLFPWHVTMPRNGGFARRTPSAALLMCLDSGGCQLGATLSVDSGSGRGRSRTA